MAEAKRIQVSPLFQDLIGSRFGRLTVVARADNDTNGKSRWQCTCDCGNTKFVFASLLRAGHTRSCGCLRRELAGKNAPRTHSMTDTPEFQAWRSMLKRCHNPTNHNFHNYGAKGITVCDEWRNDFAAFFKHVGKRPGSDHSIDRIDNLRGYEPGNCRWATATQQGRNRRTNHMLTFGGETKCITEWSLATGLSIPLLYWRLKAGWSIGRALTTPARPIGQPRRHYGNAPSQKRLPGL